MTGKAKKPGGGKHFSKAAPAPSAPARPSGPSAGEIAAAIDLLAAIENSERAADAVVAGFLRARPDLPPRFKGILLARVEAVLRQRAALDWWIERAEAGTETAARSRLLAHLVLVEGRKPDRLAELFAGEAARRFGLAALNRREAALIEALSGQALLHPDMPRAVRGAFPAWAEEWLEAAFGERLEIEMSALALAAPLDLRVNLLKASRAEAQAALAREGIEAEATPFSPLGLRLDRRIDLGRCQALHDGLIEPQDEGSQIAALLTDARPGQFVVDYCAGAGGKTLALAAAMENKGRLIAADISAGRLLRARQRFRRAGAFNVEPRDGAERKWFKRQAGRADRVLVDAPCTGIGSWRRVPDARWRLQPQDLSELVARQREILDRAAPLVASGGRLVYVTCSILPAENGDQVEGFLTRHEDFALLPASEVWAATIGGAMPGAEATLQLTPARHGTGGFFIAILERRG